MGDFRNFPWATSLSYNFGSVRSLFPIGWGVWLKVVFPSCRFWLCDYPSQKMSQRPGVPQSFL